jgi:hypothetical protein
MAAGSPSRAMMIVLLVGSVISMAGDPDGAPPTERPSICFDCFWQYQDPAFRDELIRFYDRYETDDPMLRAELTYLLARVEGKPEQLCKSFDAFEAIDARTLRPGRALLVTETLAFTAEECGRDPMVFFRKSTKLARAIGDESKAAIYDAIARKAYGPQFGDEIVVGKTAAPSGVRAYVLGESSIHVGPGEVAGVQVERTVRDWSSYQMAHDFSGAPIKTETLLAYHEGARLREIARSGKVTVQALSGTLAARSGSKWFAADENGLFRFEVLPDKLQYPTTRVWGDLALLVDTHGISSLVAPAVRHEADLVIGCGDHPSKMKAAYYLARRGVNVYFPCDRFVGEMIGHDAEGTLIGSAPVRSTRDGAIIGDRPVTFRTDETVVVEDTDVAGVLHYYDAPARYFANLERLVPLSLDVMKVNEAGQASRVTRRAVELGAKAIGVRVWNEQDYLAVREWLALSAQHRAVLFHTAPYPDGIRLFDEFPSQTTFGDTRPRFITEASSGP